MGGIGRRGRRFRGLSLRAWRAPLLLLLVGATGLVVALSATAAPAPMDKDWPRPDEHHWPEPQHWPAPHPTTTVVTTTTSVSTTTVAVPTPPVTTTVSVATPAVTTTVAVPTPAQTTTVVTQSPGPAPPPTADISLATVGAVRSVFAGENITYTDVVTNHGPSTATAVYLVEDLTGGGRFLASAASAGSCSGTGHVTCALGSLASGASDVVTLTMQAPAAAATLASSAVAGADQMDPQSANNAGRVETDVLSGHAGAPGLVRPGGAFAPPLLARAEGRVRAVTTSVTLDESASISVSILDRAGHKVTLLPGSRIDYLPTGHPHTVLQHLIDRARTVPLRLRLAAPAGRQYRIVVGALAPTGESSSLVIPFAT